MLISLNLRRHIKIYLLVFLVSRAGRDNNDFHLLHLINLQTHISCCLKLPSVDGNDKLF